MRLLKKLFFVFVILFAYQSIQAKKINVMLLTGQTDKYHNWEVTSTYLKAILDSRGIFNTDVVLIPAPGEALNQFMPDFSKYQVVVLNMNIPWWPNETMQAFLSYVKKGGGVVVIHEANNAFVNDVEFNKLIGLGGWGGLSGYPKWQELLGHEAQQWVDRNATWGPYYYWKDGKPIVDNSPGPGATHGKRDPFVITIRDKKHPITKGLPSQWLHVNDELYANLRGPAQNIHMLATAFSTKESGGTGKEEPVLFTVTYGKGRVYHCVLGHTASNYSESVQDLGFQVTFSRGTEWAATKRVKQALPKVFPTETNAILYTIDDLKNNNNKQR
jgi:type 1 glutamine amidotransferase